MTSIGAVVRGWVRLSRTRSPWLVHFDCGGCNGCDIEVLDTLTPRYSVERFGVVNVGDPRQADILVVTGPANRRNAGVLRSVFDQMSEPKIVVAVGSCAAHGGIFRDTPNVLGGVGSVVPVDAFVPGCPPSPTRILAGIVGAVPRLAEVRPARPPAGGPGDALARDRIPASRPEKGHAGEPEKAQPDGPTLRPGVAAGTGAGSAFASDAPPTTAGGPSSRGTDPTAEPRDAAMRVPSRRHRRRGRRRAREVVR